MDMSAEEVRTNILDVEWSEDGWKVGGNGGIMVLEPDIERRLALMRIQRKYPGMVLRIGVDTMRKIENGEI